MHARSAMWATSQFQTYLKLNIDGSQLEEGSTFIFWLQVMKVTLDNFYDMSSIRFCHLGTPELQGIYHKCFDLSYSWKQKEVGTHPGEFS